MARGFEGRSALRSWLYRIATNVCIDMRRAPQRRALPMDLSGPSTVGSGMDGIAIGSPLEETVWIEPIHDSRVLPDGSLHFLISLDGVVEAPSEWHFPYFDDAMGQVMGEGMATSTAFLMGRRLYDEWSSYWPGNTADEPFSSHINNIQKYVLTHRPVDDEVWNNTTVLGSAEPDAATELRALKEQGAGDITMSGSATTVRWLLANGLLDELNLLVHPIAVGKGQRLFGDINTDDLNTDADTVTGTIHWSCCPAHTAHRRAAPAVRAGAE